MARYFFSVLLALFSLSSLTGEMTLESMINEYRLSLGLSELESEAALSRAAGIYAAELAESGMLSHVDRRGGRVMDRYRAQGGSSVRAGEILGTSTDLPSILSAWKGSPSHDEIIRNPLWTRIGTAFVEKGGQYVAVVLFSLSLVDGIEYERDGDNRIVRIRPIGGAELWASAVLTVEEGVLEVLLDRDELPFVLVLTGAKGGQKGVSDFLYIGEKNFEPNH